MSGGCGYILSRGALTRFVEFSSIASQEQCAAANTQAIEDVEISICLQNAGVPAGEFRDDEFKIRFLPYEPFCVLKSNYFGSNDWTFTYPYYHLHAVSFVVCAYIENLNLMNNIFTVSGSSIQIFSGISLCLRRGNVYL